MFFIMPDHGADLHARRDHPDHARRGRCPASAGGRRGLHLLYTWALSARACSPFPRSPARPPMPSPRPSTGPTAWMKSSAMPCPSRGVRLRRWPAPCWTARCRSDPRAVLVGHRQQPAGAPSCCWPQLAICGDRVLMRSAEFAPDARAWWRSPRCSCSLRRSACSVLSCSGAATRQPASNSSRSSPPEQASA